MYNPVAKRIHDRISKKLLNRHFIDKISLSYKVLENYINKQSFIQKLQELVSKKDYSCNRALILCEDIINDYYKDAPVENWLFYIYQYTLNKSFPEAVVIDFNPSLDTLCIIYLEILRILSDFQKVYDINSWESKYPLELLSKKEEEELESSREYLRFKEAYYNEYIYEMMKLNQEVLGYSSLKHISGVHYLALYIGRQLKDKDLPIDLGRVSGAAAGHDIGKFGCKKEEAHRVPYLHYYYTDQWFRKHDIVYIRNIAINHSTWDLELENLSLESLILIYSDFRVKNKKLKDGNYEMNILSLSEAFEVILNKLDNLNTTKEMRYKRVYSKLKDFEDFLLDLGIEVELLSTKGSSRENEKKYYSLLQGNEIIDNLKYLSIRHNINLMYKLRDEGSLGSLIEVARSESDPHNLREYLNILEEYSIYLTPKQKMITMKFLFEELTHPDEDIRKQCGSMIGLLIAYFDEVYRKEVPKDVELEPPDITSNDLLKTYMDELVYPNQNLISIHKKWLANSIIHIIKSLFMNSREHQIEGYVDTLLNFYGDITIKDRDVKQYLLFSIKYIPYSKSNKMVQDTLLNYIFVNLDEDDYVLRLSALDTIYALISKLENYYIKKHFKKKLSNRLEYSIYPAENFIKIKIFQELQFHSNILEKFNNYLAKDLNKISNLYLNNLKTATDWITKRIQIDFMLEHTILRPETLGIHTAMHYCNLLKVSANENVRNRAGEALIKIMPHLSIDQRNDIAIELLRALEIEGYQFTQYIPRYLGELILYLQPIELDELIDDLIEKIKNSSGTIASMLLKTIGIAIENYPKYKELFQEKEGANESRIKRMLSIVLNGLVHYNLQVKQTAFWVTGKIIFGSNRLKLEEKYEIFKLIGKKVLTLIDENKEDKELLFLTNTAGMNNIYRFISDYKFAKGDIKIDATKNIAFFPGTFDPFSSSHKEIVKSIRDIGFEIYLSIDEFSWSKRTQPNLIRRNIVKMSIADELGVYLFPQDIPINISNSHDLLKLKQIFLNSDVHIVVGSDVLINASAYLKNNESIINTFSHIVFNRGSQHENQDEKKLEKIISTLKGNVIRLKLPPEFEDISSTQIRQYVDENRDISRLVDPMVKKYIYEKGLYRREPQYKTMLQTKSISMQIYNKFSDEFLYELVSVIPIDKSRAFKRLKEFSSKLTPRILVVRNIKNGGEIIGFSIFHWIRSSMLLKEFNDSTISEYIRNNYVGRTIVIDGIFINKGNKYENIEQMLLTETLTFCLAKDYTYGVFKNIFKEYSFPHEILELQGFEKIPGSNVENPIYVVDMTAPCTLNLDIETILKEPFISNENVKNIINVTRRRLQKAIADLYPGKLLLSFDMNMVYENMIKKICDVNGVSTEPKKTRDLGKAMCVPFGALLNGCIIPNTITKSLHTEKLFSPNIKTYRIGPYPYYLSLKNQIKMLKSFNRPVILVDDLLHKGYRIKALDPLFKEENIEVKKIIVGILSGRGKELMDLQGRDVDSAYFIPKLNVWFVESFLYPFVEGHTIWRGVHPETNLVPAVNLILPYTSPNFIKGTSKESIYRLSKICIENSMDILKVIEGEYHKINQRKLTLAHLGEVFVTPKYPDHGEDMNYDLNLNPSHYLENDLNHLKRLEGIICRD